MAEKEGNGYWLETNEAESARLLVQHRYFTAALGGLLPDTLPLHKVKTVLDVGCGPGGWVLDLVRQHRHVQATGIDISAHAVREASRLAQMHKIHSASFQQMDATQPLAFANETFDL